jgi:hypothetical protein
MDNGKRLSRNTIVQTLAKALAPLEYTHAFYDGGAAAFNRIDEYSDIDLYLVVDEKKVAEAFFVVEKALGSLSSIKQKFEILQSPWPGLSQAFYKLEEASEYLLIDFVVLTPKSPEKFLEPEMHGDVVFYFNKSDKIQPRSLDMETFVSKQQERLKRLRARFDMFNSFVRKEINRGNHLEAIDLYNVLTLATLVEALRIKHNPIHYEFKMRYIHYELPAQAIRRLQHLYFVKDSKDLQTKYHEATKWFYETMSELNQEQIGKAAAKKQ